MNLHHNKLKVLTPNTPKVDRFPHPQTLGLLNKLPNHNKKNISKSSLKREPPKPVETVESEKHKREIQ